jgi:predicted RNA-binding protein
VAGKPIPDQCLLHSYDYLGCIYGEQRWRSKDRERLYTWDSLHGEIEVFNKRGRHLGAIDPISGDTIKDAVRGRKIDV